MVKQPVRKRNRIENYDYSSPGAYFITICTRDRKPILWSESQFKLVGEAISLPQNQVPLSATGEIVKASIEGIPVYYPAVSVTDYVIMPNHIHMVLHLEDLCGRLIASPTVSTVVGQLKRRVSLLAREKIWQRSFHDHVIRDYKDYEKIGEYIHNNPLNWEKDCFYIK